MTKDALDFVGNTLDSPCPVFANVVEATPALATLVAEKVWAAERVSVVTLEFICQVAPDIGNEGEETAVFVMVLLALVHVRKNWKNSMEASRPCGGNICKRVAISITRQ